MAMENKKDDYYMDKKKEEKKVKKIVFIITSSVLSLIVLGILGLFLYINSAMNPIDKNATSELIVSVPIGASSSNIATLLEEQKVIKNATIFKFYVKFKNEGDFKAGEHRFTQAMGLQEVIAELQNGKVSPKAAFVVTIPEGKHLEQIVGILAKKFDLNEKDMLEKLNDKQYLKELQAQFPSVLSDKIFDPNIRYPLEGYLFPATYEYVNSTPTVDEIIKPMLQKTQAVLDKYRGQMDQKKMDVHTLLTMSSLVEEEATAATDRKKIASVFYNRMKIGMPLQTDPTVLYALGNHKDRVLYEDLNVDSPYNTYKVNGLPVGPIANAGEDSIVAALEPTQTDYLYFLASKEGKVYYAKTFEQHKALKAEHITGK